MSMGADFVDDVPEEGPGRSAPASRSMEAPAETHRASMRATREPPLLSCLSSGDNDHFEERPERQVESEPELAGASDDDDDDVAASAEQSFLERQTKAVEKSATAATHSAAVEAERLRMESEALDLKRAQASGSGAEAADAHDAHDHKCLRMIVNNCAGEVSAQPPKRWLKNRRPRRRWRPRDGKQLSLGALIACWSAQRSIVCGSLRRRSFSV